MKKLNRGFVALFSSQAIRKTALSLLSVFMPIFLFGIFERNIFLVIAFYAAGAFLYALFLPFGTRFLNRFGFKRSIIIGSLFGILYFAILVFTNEENVWLLIPIVIAVLTIFRLLYWIPYHVDFAKFTDTKERGRGVAAMFAAISFAGIIGPIVAGYILDKTNFSILFTVVIALYALSLIPLFRLPRVNETYSWRYKETWRHLFSEEYRRPLIAIAARGAENVVALVIWPLFIFLLLREDVLDVGAISTIIFGAVVILQLALGRFIDVSEKRRYETLRIGSILYALGWVAKMFVLTAFHIFLAGFYHGITKIFTRTPFDTLVYEITADQGHYVDEYTVLKEMALQIGKVAGLAATALLLFFLPLEWTFMIAAGATLLLNVLYYRKRNREDFTEERVGIPQHQLHH